MGKEPVLVVLGSAQDGGIPHAGCDCGRCLDAAREPGLRRMSPSAAVVTGSQAFLLDASPDLPRQMELLRRVMGDHIAPLPSAIFLTHCHWGHYAGLGWLGKESADSRGIPLHCTPAASQFITGSRPWRDLVDRGNVDLRVMETESGIEIGSGLSIIPRWVQHRADASDTVAFQVVRQGPRGRYTLLYMPDIDDLDERAQQLVSGSTTALIDATFYSKTELRDRPIAEVPHPAVAQSAPILSSLGMSGRVIFTHLNHTNPLVDPGSPKRHAVEEQGFRVAWDGMAIPLP